MPDLLKHQKLFQKAKLHLATKDRVLKNLIDKYPDLSWQKTSPSALVCLLRAIIGQQISSKAADAIWQRLLSLHPVPSANDLLATDTAKLKKVGLSTAKIACARALSRYSLEHNLESYAKEDYEFIANRLLKIKGIGPWTVDMFAIFYALKANIFPNSDLALLKTIHQLYNNQQALPLSQVKVIAKNWEPYRTIASLYLWRTLDTTEINY